MTKEQDILSLFQQGYSPKDIIGKGFSKSTVYRVYEQFKVITGNINKPIWLIENITYNKWGEARYLPGENVSMNFSFKNVAERDFYLINIGVQTEWMAGQNIWYSQKVNEVVKPGQSRYFNFVFQIPRELPLGEYTLMFGVEGQYLPVQTFQEQQVTTMWSEPQVIHVKHAASNLKIFLSHSVRDEHLVRELKKHLENYGITVSSAQDSIDFGQPLVEQTQNLINSCDIFIALMTESAAQSAALIRETDYAILLNKPRILMREESVPVNTQHGWLTFSKYENEQQILNKILTAITQVRNNVVHSNTAAMGAIGLALLAFLIGYGLSRGR